MKALAYLSLSAMLMMAVNTGLFAQGLEDEDTRTAAIQYTIKYRFGPDIKAGDWVKYQTEAEEGEEPEVYELKVTKEEKGNLWIEEHFNGFEAHYLINPDKMELIRGEGTDDKGEKWIITPLGDEKFNEVMGMIKAQMGRMGGTAQILKWKTVDKTEKLDITAGSFNCNLLVPEYSEQYASKIEEYEQTLRDSGKSEEEIEKIIYGNAPKLYFCDDVPRLLPFNIAMGWMPFIEAFGEVEGGLVECRHMAPMKLAAYSK